MSGSEISAVIVAVAGLGAAWFAYSRVARAMGWSKFCVLRRNRNGDLK